MSEEAQITPLRPIRAAGDVALVILAVLAVGATITRLGPVLEPFVLAIFLFFLTRPAAAALIRRGLPAPLAYSALMLIALGVLFTIVLFAGVQAYAFQAQWPRYERRLMALSSLGSETMTKQSMAQWLNESATELHRFAYATGIGAAELLLMAFFYLVFFVLGAEKLAKRVARALPADHAARMSKATAAVRVSMEQYVRVKTIVSAGLGLSAGLLTWAFGVKQPLLWGFLFFLLNYITYLGSIAALAPPVIVAFLDGMSAGGAIGLALLLTAIRFAWIDYVEMSMSGRHLNLDPALLLLWITYWGWAWGVLGLVLACPMLVALKILLENLEGGQPLATLLSEE